MERRVFALLTEPSGELYSELLDLAAKECRVALLVIRRSLPLSGRGMNVLSRLERFLRDSVESSEWPGTKLLGEAASVLHYDLGPECAEVLKEATDSLYGWTQPDLPEDLCLLKDEGMPWLVSIAHERDGYFCLSQDERNRLLSSLPQLSAVLAEE